MINYTGNPAATESPSPAPGPGVVPISTSPQDGIDAVANVSVGQTEKVLTDFEAYLQKTAMWRPPRAPASGNGQGFTAVTLVGSGPASGIAPIAVSSTNAQLTSSPYNFVFKIIAGGAIGVATFQVSLDGGNTFGGTTTTAATYTEVTSSIIVAMTGTLVTGDTYSFSASDTNIGGFVGIDGYLHGGFDRYGYPRLGRLVHWREDWGALFNLTASQNPITNNPRWIGTSHNAINYFTAVGVTPNPFRVLTMNSGAVLATDGTYITQPPWSLLAALPPVCLDYWMSTGVGIANLSHTHGFAAPDPFNSFAGGILGGAYFLRRGTAIGAGPLTGGPDTTWKAVTDNGVTATIIDTGATITTSTQWHFAIEIWPSGLSGVLAGAPLTRFFINGKLVAVSTATQPGSLAVAFGFSPSAAATSSGMSIGPAQFCASTVILGQNAGV